MSEMRRVLIGKWTDLYLNNAAFYHAVNQLAELLPHWVEGLAAYAVTVDEEQRRHIEIMKGTP